MRYLQNYLQHRLNPLHVYCRLVDVGFSQQAARGLCGVYERVYRFLTPGS